MAKKITRSEIAENDLFGGIRQSAEETISVIDKLSQALTETAEAVKKSVGGAKFDSTKAIDNFVKSTEKANRLTKQAIELDKAKANAVKARKQAMAANQKQLQEQEKTVQQRIKTEETLARQKARVNKEAERAARVAKAEASEYTKLVKKTRDLKNQSKELAAQMLKLESSGKRNTSAYRELRRTYRGVTKEAKAGDATLKKIDSTVGDNFRNVGNYTGALKKLGGAMATLAGGFGIMKLLRGATDIVVNFDQAVADLGAISSQSTEEELEALTAQAKELGATTQFSATQITEMQIELAKLGFTADQIQDSTAGVANFAAATGADIPAAAALAGSALRGFGLEASEMERVVSTLGVATTKSALDFEKLNSGLAGVAPVANAF
jgi:chromosome segregation ATPase